MVINHKSPFRKAGKGLSVIWQGRQAEQGEVVAIPGLLFYRVTKIVAVKIRLGVSQPHLLAETI